MRRLTTVLIPVGLFAVIGVVHHHLFAQVVEPAVVEPAVVASPTYIAIPPRQQELVTVAAPSAQHVWVSGQWERMPDSWSWTAGKWVQPPFSNAYWVPGYWKHHGGRYVWQSAHWAVANQGVIVNKPVTMPPVYAEVKPAPPAGASNLAWQPGYWDWRGTWVWVPGEYIATASPQAVWVPGEWVAGVEGSWRWSPAHWSVA